MTKTYYITLNGTDPVKLPDDYESGDTVIITRISDEPAHKVVIVLGPCHQAELIEVQPVPSKNRGPYHSDQPWKRKIKS